MERELRDKRGCQSEDFQPHCRRASNLLEEVKRQDRQIDNNDAGEYQVSRVVDGDTIIVKKGSTKLTIRLVGIDAPEVSHAKNQPGQPFSQQSTKYLAGLVLNKTVDIKSHGPDRYGRALGEVFLDGNNINLEMVKSGLAEVYRGTPAKGQNMEPYWKAEEEARKSGKGIWVLGDKYVSPREWRKTHGN